MKKIFWVLTLFMLLTGCGNDNSYLYNDIKIDMIDMDSYVDDNPIKVSLYQGNRKITNYSTTLGNFKDIGVFNVYYTDSDILDSSAVKYNFKKYYQKYSGIDNYKIGFFISFDVGDEHFEKLILDPSSKHSLGPYMYIYLYDDINQTDGSFYSHLEPEDMNDNTIISSIKLFFPQRGVDITSPIKLTVFTYDSLDDFTSDNFYRGKSSYTINIDTIKP